jgi:hypothetical protein
MKRNYTINFSHLSCQQSIVISDRKVGPWTQRIYEALTAIQWGTAPDPFGWMVPVSD